MTVSLPLPGDRGGCMCFPEGQGLLQGDVLGSGSWSSENTPC